jgi:superfamily II DNA or RNA helicase
MSVLLPDKCWTTRGYSIAKSALTAAQLAHLEKTLFVKPVVPPTYAGTVSAFPLFLASASRYYVPAAWGVEQYGKPLCDGRPVGVALPTSLSFRGSLRPHQEEALAAFEAAERSGIICLPCGYGKTFTGIAAALRIGRCFLIVVHKEFLADQWSTELKALVPGIRIGRVQGDRCDVGDGFDVSIAMIQTICSRAFPPETFARFGFAVFDEVHHLAAEHFSQTLQRIQCRAMLGLTATPVRVDGLSKVFAWFLGPICYQIKRRPTDATVGVNVLRYECADTDYTNVPTNWKGELVRAHLINKIADYTPRTAALIEWVVPDLRRSTDRKLLILSDRREHLTAMEGLLRSTGISSVAYYVGGMKQKDLDKSTEAQVILGTFAMASEGMNIPTLNAVLLATPKSNIEQSVGRILRVKPEDRTIQPLIFDVLDAAFVECMGQWNKRRKFYKDCGYKVQWKKEGDDAVVEEEKEEKEDVPKESSGHGFLLHEEDPIKTAPSAGHGFLLHV